MHLRIPCLRAAKGQPMCMLWPLLGLACLFAASCASVNVKYDDRFHYKFSSRSGKADVLNQTVKGTPDGMIEIGKISAEVVVDEGESGRDKGIESLRREAAKVGGDVIRPYYDNKGKRQKKLKATQDTTTTHYTERAVGVGYDKWGRLKADTVRVRVDVTTPGKPARTVTEHYHFVAAKVYRRYSKDDLNKQDEDGNALLVSIAKSDMYVPYYVGLGAEVNAKDNNQDTALHWAVIKDNLESVSFLLEKGANIHSRNKWGMTPLGLGMWKGHERIVDLLLANGATLDDVKPEHKIFAFFHAAKTGNLKTLAHLVDSGGDVNLQDTQHGDTALHWAAARGQVQAVKALIERGATLDPVNHEGWTPLLLATEKGHEDAALVLMQKGANLAARNKDNRTPLFGMAQHNMIRAARIAIASGVDIEARDKEDMTPLYFAAIRGGEDVGLLLVEQGADMNALHKNGYCPLHGAGRKGLSRLFFVLLDHGANPRFVSKNKVTVLHNASIAGTRAMIERLLDLGLDINAKSETGETPLHYAVRNKNVEAVKVLLEHGADVKAWDRENRTPVDWARKLKQYEIIRLLKESGN